MARRRIRRHGPRPPRTVALRPRESDCGGSLDPRACVRLAGRQLSGRPRGGGGPVPVEPAPAAEWHGRVVPTGQPSAGGRSGPSRVRVGLPPDGRRAAGLLELGVLHTDTCRDPAPASRRQLGRRPRRRGLPRLQQPSAHRHLRGGERRLRRPPVRHLRSAASPRLLPVVVPGHRQALRLRRRRLDLLPGRQLGCPRPALRDLVPARAEGRQGPLRDRVRRPGRRPGPVPRAGIRRGHADVDVGGRLPVERCGRDTGRR